MSTLDSTFNHLVEQLHAADKFMTIEEFETSGGYGSDAYVEAARKAVDAFFTEHVKTESPEPQTLVLSLYAPVGVEATLYVYGSGDTSDGRWRLVARDTATGETRAAGGFISDICQEMWYQRVNGWL